MPGWLDVTIRTVSAVVLILASARLLVRKNLQHMTQTEILIMAFFAAMLGAGTIMLTVPIVYPLLGFFIAALTLYGVQILKLKSQSFRTWMQAVPVPVIKNGKILEEAMKKQRLSSDELEAGLRRKGVFSVQDVEFAMLEDTGEIDVLLKSSLRPVTARDLHLNVLPVKETETIVRDGKIQHESLNRIGLTQRWIEQKVEAMNLTMDNVFLAQADRDGQLYIDTFDDQLKQKKPNEKAELWNALRNAEADLKSFARHTDNRSARQMYELCAVELEELKDKLKLYLAEKEGPSV
ncbi:DUF421 domain-containing protein [Alteribacter lacisalsi]|nr:DUF421 domain-containing protein [Alteribacter lacisalsi]